MKYCPSVIKLFAVASSLWHLMEPLNIMFGENFAQILFYCSLMNEVFNFTKILKILQKSRMRFTIKLIDSNVSLVKYLKLESVFWSL